MHPYTTDSDERKYVPVCVAAIAILAAWILNRVIQSTQFIIPWWIDAPSVIGFYALFYTIFNKFLWRKHVFRTVGLIKIPDLNGMWKGFVTSSFDEAADKHDVDVKILQNWTKISITLEARYSKSHSLIAAIITQDPTGVVLSYEYLNEPRANAKRTMHIHRGTARLTMQPNAKLFEGEYYTGRDRQCFGVLRFERP